MSFTLLLLLVLCLNPEDDALLFPFETFLKSLREPHTWQRYWIHLIDKEN